MAAIGNATTDAGVFTAEGLAGGSFAAVLASQRQKEHADFERKRAELAQVAAKKSITELGDKFATSSSVLTAGTAGEHYGLSKLGEARPSATSAAAAPVAEAAAVATAASKAAGAKRRRGVLSFAADLDGEEGSAGAAGAPPSTSGAIARAAAASSAAAATPAVPATLAKLGKDPSVDTTFLPDKDREAQEALLREQLKQEFIKEQEAIKKQKLEIVYSYWDGSGHRRAITVPKGTPVGKFLEWVRQDLVADFPEMRNVSGDQLLYVKEDLIIPHGYSFYDLIATKARGKSGPLFCFDVHDDVRMTLDARVEKDESHPGKVIERRVYERSKHIFPYSRWEIYDPNVKRDKYTVHGDEVYGSK